MAIAACFSKSRISFVGSVFSCPLAHSNGDCSRHCHCQDSVNAEEEEDAGELHSDFHIGRK